MTQKKPNTGNHEEPSGDNDKTYKIGYGKPPEHTRFRPGQSGNPKGRKKGSNNFSTDLAAVLKAPVKTRDGGKTTKLSTQMATLLILREKALKGDGKSIDKLVALAAQFNDNQATQQTSQLADEDKAIFDGFFARTGNANAIEGPASDETETPLVNKEDQP